MSSTRSTAYKAKLREQSTSITNRRRSRGQDRKMNRDVELNKRRNLPKDMSPVAEKYEPDSVFKHQTRTKKGAKNDKGDNLLDRLKQWREDKKRRVEQEKRNAASKPVFKAGNVAREAEVELFKGGAEMVKSKVVPVSKTSSNGKKPSVTAGSKVLDKKATKVVEKRVPQKKKVTVTKTKEQAPPVTRVKRVQVQSSTDLSSKLTAAAAAKRNSATSPKKFLRATRANTLRKTESVTTKKGVKNAIGVSKSTGNLLATKKMDVVENMDEVDISSYELKDDVTETPTEEDISIFQPKEVPKLLMDFNFSAMASSSNDNSGSDSKDDESYAGRLTFAGVPLKAKRKSTRKSTRCEIPESGENNESESSDNLITFTPGNSRRSVRRSTRMSTVMGNPQPLMEEIMETNVEENSNLPLATPKSAKRNGGTRRSVQLNSPSSSALDDENLPSLVNSKSAKRKSVRRSIRLVTVEETEECPSSNLVATPKSAQLKSTTPKSRGRNSNRQSKVFSSLTTSKRLNDLHLSDNVNHDTSDFNIDTDLPEPVDHQGNKSSESDMPSTPLSSKSSRGKSFRKSMSLAEALDLVQSDSEIAMEVDAAPQTLTDVDTQLSLVDVTSTPKDLSTSAKTKRRSMMSSSAALSSIVGDLSPSLENLPKSASRSHSRRSGRSARRSSVLRRRSRKSTATPAKRDSVGDLNISNMLTPNSMRNIENIPRSVTPRRTVRRSTVISVSDEGTDVGRELEPAVAYKLEKTSLSAKASRILNELVIEKVDGEKSFFEVSFDESIRDSQSQNNSINIPLAKSNNLLTNKSLNGTPKSNNTSPFTPRKSNEVTTASSSSSVVSSPLSTPTSALRTRHSVAPSSGFKEPGLPLSALRRAGSSQRRRTYCTPKSRTPEQGISILKKSPMVEMTRRRSKHMSSPVPVKGQYFKDLVSNETERLTNLSVEWNNIASNESGLQEEVLGQIRTTVGQALLLMQQRFKQFSGLVDNYVYDLGEKKTTPTDLQGFWDMIYFQVEDVHNKFKDLEALQMSGWQIKPSTPKAGLLKKKLTAKAKPKTKGVKSNFAAFKAEMMKKKEMAKSSVEEAC